MFLNRSLYLFDTSVISDLLRNSGGAEQIRARMSKVGTSRIAISTITEAELRFGVGKIAPAPRFELAVNELLSNFEILPWNSDAARSYALLRDRGEKQGTMTGPLDLLIAALAMATSRTLVTRDQSFIVLRKWLRVEDWAR